MGYIPADPSGRLSNFDTRNLWAKVTMWFWKRFSRKVVAQTFYMEHITGEKTHYRNCIFKRCRFDGLRLVFIENSLIEYDTPMPTFTNMAYCEVTRCHLVKVNPLIDGASSPS